MLQSAVLPFHTTSLFATNIFRGFKHYLYFDNCCIDHQWHFECCRVSKSTLMKTILSESSRSLREPLKMLTGWWIKYVSRATGAFPQALWLQRPGADHTGAKLGSPVHSCHPVDLICPCALRLVSQMREWGWFPLDSWESPLLPGISVCLGNVIHLNGV